MVGTWRRRQGGIALAAAWALGSACEQQEDSAVASEPGYEPTMVVVADSAHERFRYLRLDTDRVVLDIDLDAIDPARCGSATCVAFGAEPSVDPATGDDRLLVTYAPHDDGATMASAVAMLRVTADAVEVEWSFSDLDFATHLGARSDLCAAATPCSLPGGDFASRRGCGLYHAHDVELVEESEEGVLLWIADTTRPSRAVRAFLPAGASCAVVEAVVSAATATGLPLLDDANDVDAVTIAGEPMVMVSYLSGTATGTGGFAAFTGDADAWQVAWTYPENGPLAAPHAPMVVDGDDGAQWLVYAHGNGNGLTARADDYSEGDHHGTIGFARLVDGAPRYAAEVYPTGGMGFARDVDPLPGGRWLVTDSGCHENTAPECSNEAYVRQFEASLPSEVAEVDGRFTPGHEYQERVEVPEPGDTWPSPVPCDLVTPYDTDRISEPGPGLQARERAATETCGG